MTADKHQVIIWLEDKPLLNQPIETELKKYPKYSLIVCKSLKELYQQTQDYSLQANKVAGFVLDILIKGDDLTDLGMPTVLTTGGNDTGVAVLRNYLRNIEGDAPHRDTWKNHKVLVLTSLNETYRNSRYDPLMKWEEKNGNNTEWLSKTDEDGSKSAAIKSIENWIKKL
jgi:hypothetical protein